MRGLRPSRRLQNVCSVIEDFSLGRTARPEAGWVRPSLRLPLCCARSSGGTEAAATGPPAHGAWPYPFLLAAVDGPHGGGPEGKYPRHTWLVLLQLTQKGDRACTRAHVF